MHNNQETLSRKLKIGLPLLAGTAALAGAVFTWHRLLNRPLPAKCDKYSLHALEKPVEIIRDRWGVPHIYAQNEHDLFFAQGFVHAQDRLFQMDTFRRTGAGRISELVGPSGLATDRFARYFGWHKVAEVQVSNADEEVQELMAAYCAGTTPILGCANCRLNSLF